MEAVAQAALTRGRFVVPAADFSALCASTGLSAAELLPRLVSPVRVVALPPISSFRVGAAALGVSGAVYLGCNLEFKGLPLNSAVHAEQCAVTLARRAAEGALTHLATSAVPCGHCRQWLYELPGAEKLVCLGGPASAGAEGVRAPRALSALLPDAFGPDSLLPGGGRRLLGPRHNGVQLDAKGRAKLAEWRKAGTPHSLRMVEAAYCALAAANGAHAPYSSCPAGAALVGSGGGKDIHAGGCAESAAFNPTISPLQAALIGAYADGAVGGGEGWAGRLQDCVLVELGGAGVSYQAQVAATLSAIAPACTLTVLHCEDFRASRL